MPSRIIPVRLNTAEQEMLATCQASDVRGDMNASELFRLLLHREYNRRVKGTSKVSPGAIASESRNGRPKKKALDDVQVVKDNAVP